MAEFPDLTGLTIISLVTAGIQLEESKHDRIKLTAVIFMSVFSRVGILSPSPGAGILVMGNSFGYNWVQFP